MFVLTEPQYVYSKLFQQLKFQLLCHNLLFQCRFIFDFCLIFQKNYDINYLQFFMFYSMVDKCLMTLGQQFSIFWQQAGYLEICSYQYYQPFIHLIYKQLRLYINLYIKKQYVFLLRNDGLHSIYILSNQVLF